ncbi:MAG: hypothetical protein ACRD04_01750 [Terriglobales bacterium]
MKLNFGIPGTVLALTLAVGLAAQSSPATPSLQQAQKSLTDAQARLARAQRVYQRALVAINSARWKTASREMADAQSSLQRLQSRKADGALYWLAYAEAQQGQRLGSLQQLKRLLRRQSSTWDPDARALQLQLRMQLGQPVSPQAQPGDDLKLLALNGLMNTDPSQALPLLEQVLNGHSDATVKDRALFVLAQNQSPAATAELERVAAASPDPRLQAAAARDLVLSGDDVTRLLPLAQTHPRLRLALIHALTVGSSPRASAALLALYPGASDRAASVAVINSLFDRNDAPALVHLARQERDPQLQLELVRALAQMNSPVATAYLMEILKQ